MKKGRILSLLFIGSLMLIFISTISISAQILARMEGTVISEDGKPIAGARVILIFSEDGTKFELTTDNKGKWAKSNLLPGKWTVGIIAEGYEPQNLDVMLSSLKRNIPIDVTLSRIPESPLIKGNTLYEEKKYGEALEEYQRILKENPDNPEIDFKIGLCHYKMNDLDKAIESFKAVLEKEPRSQETLINLSAIYFEKGDLDEGMKYFQQVDEKTVTDPGTLYNIGILLFQNGQTDAAIGYFQKCLAVDPNNVNAYYQLGLANLNMNNLEEAKKNLQKVIELAPESDNASIAKKILETIQK